MLPQMCRNQKKVGNIFCIVRMFYNNIAQGFFARFAGLQKCSGEKLDIRCPV